MGRVFYVRVPVDSLIVSSPQRRRTTILALALTWMGCSPSQSDIRNADAKAKPLAIHPEDSRPVPPLSEDTNALKYVDTRNADRDRYGFADEVDQCPEAIELYNHVDDDDGCPDVGSHGIRLDDSGTMLLRDERILYRTNEAEVHPQSLEQIAALSEVIKSNPTLGVIRIEVHTDDVGSNQYNLTLSQRRADEVRELLVRAGVKIDRLMAVGMGDSTPIISEAPYETRRLSRRTEFWIQAPNSRPN